MRVSNSIHVAANGIIWFFLWLSSISHSYIFLIHLSVDGHLDCFHVLAIANSATVNTGVHVSFSMKVLSGYMPRSGLLDLIIVLYLVF